MGGQRAVGSRARGQAEVAPFQPLEVYDTCIAPEAPVPFAPRCILQACGNYSDQIYRDID